MTLSKNRLVTVDSLRGFALLGIMLAHFVSWYTAGPLPQEIYAKYNSTGNQIVGGITEILVVGKFFAFFSFLFGLSFYLQMRGLMDDQKTFVARYAWRLGLLMVIGLIHHALWMGDILSIYVPLGFVLLFMRKLGNKAILILGIIMVTNVPGKIINLVQILTHAQQNFGDFVSLAKSYDHVIIKGSLVDILVYNTKNFSTKYNFQIFSGRLFITLGFFLLGMFVGRQKWFDNHESSRAIFRKICKKSSLIMLGALVAGVIIMVTDSIFKLGWQQNPVAGLVFSIFYDIFNAAMTVFYISGLTLLMYRKTWQSVLFKFAPVGKMALTSYITQTIVGLTLFYGIGFGLYGKTSPGVNYLIGISVFIAQVIFSSWWLHYFNYGILEWLWRSGTLLKWQPLLKRKSANLIVDPSTLSAPLAEDLSVKFKGVTSTL